jgi:hypothetical protein
METGQNGVLQFHFDGTGRSSALRLAGAHSGDEQKEGQESFHRHRVGRKFTSSV